MQMPIDIRFRNMHPSRRLEQDIRKRIEHLGRFFDRLLGAHIMVEQPHHHHQSGSRFHVRIELHVPGETVVVSHDAGRNEDHEHARIAVHQAFAALERRLEDHVRRVRGQTKHHEPAPAAKIAQLFPDEDHGFLETPDGREIYFHRNSVLGGRFDSLEIGEAVLYSEEAGERGPQASSVHAL